MRGRFLGHPVHPPLVSFPSALFPASFLADLIALGTDDAFWWMMAVWLLAGGLLGTVGAVVSGLLEFSSVPHGPARQVARRHRALGVSILVLYLVIAAFHAFVEWDRSAWPVLLAVVLNFAGQVMLSFQGVWGGWLVFRHGVGLK